MSEILQANSASNEYDTAIIGAGPAGISAAIWCSELGLNSILIEKNRFVGGMLLNVFNPIANYPGLTLENGEKLARLLENNLKQSNCGLELNCEVTEVDWKNRAIITGSDKSIKCRVLIFAAGTRRKTLNVKGEKELLGKGILMSAKRDGKKASDAVAAVIGGGDAALENALILSEFADKVFLIRRRTDFSARKDFVDKVTQSRKIVILENTQVLEFCGKDRLEYIKLKSDKKGIYDLEVNYAVVRIGFQPNSELLKELVETDSKGYIITNNLWQTSVGEILAIGDVACPVSPTIATAVGAGATAAKYAYSLLKKLS
ncbi:MAG TPA: FAD-dependent oxidoreductase [Pyrinomonadaceae bacterium]|nr:FAD-dependent oxidoreductase [Pyrinomonadaceae bacterium]